MLFSKLGVKISIYTIAVHSLKRSATTALTKQQAVSGEANVLYDYIHVGEILSDITTEASSAYGTKNWANTPKDLPTTAAPSTTSNVICGHIDVHDTPANIVMEPSPAYQTNKEVKRMPGLQQTVPSSLYQ